MPEGFLRARWDPPPEHAPTTRGQRDLIERVRWAGGEVSLRNAGGDGREYIGPSGEDGVLLVVRRASSGGYVARLEDRSRGNSWAGARKLSIGAAVANLHRECKRLSRAGGVGGKIGRVD